MNQTKKMNRMNLAGLFLLGLPALSSAQETSAKEANEPVHDLAPFVVTTDGAQNILYITERDMSQRQAIDLEDTLSIDPSITVGGSTGVAQKIYVRNLGEGMLNISVDGATQSGALFHHTGRIAIEPELLKRVEVQPGAGNAADGPGALGGAIRFVTKNPEDFLAPGQNMGGLLKYGYFSNTRGYKASATGVARINDQWSALLSFTPSEHEDIEDGNGNRLEGSGTRQAMGLLKVVGHLGNGHTLRFSFENLEEEGEKLRRPEWAPGPSNPAFPMEGTRRTAVVGYEFVPDEGGWLDLTSTLSYSDADIYQNAVFGPYEGNIESIQLDMRNNHRFNVHELIYGIDHRTDEVFAGPSGATETYSEEGSVTGLFLQGNYEVKENLTINAGARADFYHLRDRQGQEFESEGVSPNLGFTYDFTQDFSVNASYATAYRGPGISDAFRIDRSDNDPGLDAEKARNYEVRFVYQKSPLTLEAGLYRNRIEDVITNTLPWSVVYTNSGELETDGAFARVTYGTQNVNISLQYNHADTTINGETATRYQYSSLVSRIGDTWVLDAFWRPLPQLDMGWNSRLVEGLDNILVPEYISGVPGSYIDKPGYVTHDFYLRWKPEFVDHLTLSLTVKNIFDKYYLSHGSVEDLTALPGFGAVIGAPEPGRDIRISASLSF